MELLEELTNAEIHSKLIELGYEVGPITPTTRRVYLKKLNSLLNENSMTLNDTTTSVLNSSINEISQVDSKSKRRSVTRSPTRRKSPSRQVESNIPLANSTVVDSSSRIKYDLPSSSRDGYRDLSTPKNRNEQSVYSPSFKNVPSSRSDSEFGDDILEGLKPRTPSSFNGTNVFLGRLGSGSGIGDVFRSKQSLSSQVSPRDDILTRDFDPDKPYTSDFTRHLSSISAHRIAAATNSRVPLNPRIYNSVKENDDEDGIEEQYSRIPQRGWFDMARGSRVNLLSYRFPGETWCSRDASVLLFLLVSLFFVFLGYAYIQIHHSSDTTSVASRRAELMYPKCDSVNQASSDCIREKEIEGVMSVLRLVENKLEEMVALRGCSSDPPHLTTLQIKDLVNEKITTMDPWRKESSVEELKLLIRENPNLGVVLTSEGVSLKSLAPSLYCSFLAYFLLTAGWIFKLLLVVGVVGGVVVACKWYVTRQARRREELYKMVSNILQLVSAKSSQEGYAVISHIRDMIVPFELRNSKRALWNEAAKMVESDSRIRTEVQQVEGEDFYVWRWLASPVSNKKGWQGQAFDTTMKGSVNSLPDHSPTPCLKIRHMFDPSKEEGEARGDEWTAGVADTVLEKCRGASVVHLAVDKHSQEGCVYLMCASRQHAGLAYRALHGYWFNRNLVTVKFVRLNRYLERFPDAANATTPLQPSSSASL